MAGRVDHWFCGGLPGARGVSGQALEARVRQYLQVYGPDDAKNIQVSGFVNVEKAYQAASGKANPDDRIVVFGSFLTVAEALSAVGRA